MTAIKTASRCLFPHHHRKESGPGLFPVLALAAAAAAAIVIWRYRIWIATFAAFGVGLAVVEAAVRVAMLEPAARRYWLAARWHRFGWRRLAKNIRLGYLDRHRGDQVDSGRARTVNIPRARFRATPHGLEVRMRTTHGIGRIEVEKAAPYLADAWKAARISVSQPRPGRLVVRAHRTDPLLTPLLYGTSPGRPDVRMLYLGRDEHGQHRHADIGNVPGIVVGGQPGAGKSTQIAAWLAQLAPDPAVQFALCDGKGAAEMDDYLPRAWLAAGDGLDDAISVLEQVHDLMTSRLGCVRTVLGSKNVWHAGVTAEWPLVVTVLDECQQYFDVTLAKGDKEREPKMRRAILLASSLIRRGRSVGMLTIPATQKPTTDSLPSSIRDNCPLSLAFGLKTTDAAVATLGSSIRDYPSYSPVTLADPAYAGCCTASLRTGQDPFTRLRAPWITEDQAAAVTAASAHLRQDPRALLPVVVPDDVRELVG